MSSSLTSCIAAHFLLQLDYSSVAMTVRTAAGRGERALEVTPGAALVEGLLFLSSPLLKCAWLKIGYQIGRKKGK